MEIKCASPRQWVTGREGIPGILIGKGVWCPQHTSVLSSWCSSRTHWAPAVCAEDSVGSKRHRCPGSPGDWARVESTWHVAHRLWGGAREKMRREGCRGAGTEDGKLAEDSSRQRKPWGLLTRRPPPKRDEQRPSLRPKQVSTAPLVFLLKIQNICVVFQ